MIVDASISNPYVGPRTFSYEQRHLFFGREREARDLLARVLSERLLLFYAQSGAGKSSLLYTRLIPQLQEEKGFVVLPVGRVGGELPSEVEQVDNIYVFNLMLSIDAGNDPARLAHVTLSDFLARLARRTVTDAAGQERKDWVYDASLAPAPAAAGASTRRYALIIDQFEEIITAHPGLWREREEFFRQLDAAMQADPSLWVVLTLREDYVASLDPYASLMADRLRARFYMERMGADAALAAIRRPAELAGRPFAGGVAEQLAEDLRQVRVPGQQKTIAGQYVEPVQLQVACYQLWENITGRPAGPITAQDLVEAGDVNQALSRFYEQTLQDVLANPALSGITERQLRTWFDKELITADGTRDLVRQGEEVTSSLPNAVVGQLQKRFLVRAEARGGDTWIELVHDRFIEPIRQSNLAWFARNLNPLTQAARAWQEAGRLESKLYVDSQLAAAAAQLQANPAEFGEAERNFLEEGQKAEARRVTRRQQRITWGAAALALIFIALAVWALWSRGEARTSAAAAVDARTTAEADRIRAVTAEAEAVDQSLAAQDARDTAIFLQGRERNARSEAEANATAAIAAKATAEAASTKAVAGEATAQAANTAQVKALNDLAANLEANIQVGLTAQAPTIQPLSPTSTATAGTTPTPPVITPGTPLQALPPTPTGTPTSTSTVTPPPTTNRTVIAQQTQLAQVRATQTALAAATIPPPKGRIVFASNRGSPWVPLELGLDLWSTNLALGDITQLTSRTGYEPSYSLARDRVAFTARVDGGAVDLFEIPPTGGNPRPLDEHRWSDWEPSYSPDGRRVAFTSSRDNQDWEIWTMGVDGGSNPRQLTKDDPALNWSPSWSPDGRYIAYFSTRLVPAGRVEVWRMDADGSNKTRLTDGNWLERNLDSIRARSWGLSWSPNSKEIAFPSNRDGNSEIYVMDWDGKNARNLTSSPGSDEFDPAWSLDGNWIALVRPVPDAQLIFLKSIDARQELPCTWGNRIDGHPVWLP
jgi:Tol biopolymer transport system component